MVRFQPLLDASSSSDSDDSTTIVNEKKQQQRSLSGGGRQSLQQRTPQRSAAAMDEVDDEDDDEDEDDEIALPLRNRTPHVLESARKAALATQEHHQRDAKSQRQLDREFDEEDDEYQEEQKYQSTSAIDAPYSSHPHHGAQSFSQYQQRHGVDHRKLQIMDAVLRDVDYDIDIDQPQQQRQRQRQQKDDDDDVDIDDGENMDGAAAEATLDAGEQIAPDSEQTTSFQTQTHRSTKITSKSPMVNFLSQLHPYARPATRDQYLPGNPLIDAAAAASSASAFAASASKRSHLEFMQHSYRVGWSANSLFYAGSIDGSIVVAEPIDPLAVDIGAMSTLQPASTGNAYEKKLLTRTILETHLAFHSKHTSAVPSSAKVFGASHSSSSSNTFGASSFVSPFEQISAIYTPFTQLIDAYISALRGLQSPTFGGGLHAPLEEVEYALSTFQLLRTLYSVEEAEQRAPKLTRTAEQAERALRAPSVSASTDLSVGTARDDPYALAFGREAAFEQAWLQPSVAASYVTQRVRQLQEQVGVEGSDRLTGTKMQQVIAYLIGHDLFAASEACLSAGNFRLATLISQLDSYSYSGRLQADGHPVLEVSQHDIGRQLSHWLSKDRGMGEFIPEEIIQIYRLMSGDILIQPSLAWIEILGLHFWYTQPKSSQSNIQHALMNYKKHAFMSQAVKKPFPAYQSYLEVAQRSGGRQHQMNDEDAQSYDEAITVYVGSSAPPRNSTEYYDLRYGLLELYTQQSRHLSTVLSPQTHVPHILDHSLSWHLHSVLQSTPLAQFGPNQGNFIMSFVHQLELMSEMEKERDLDFWKWCIYVTQASVVPPDTIQFDRDQVMKHILMRHVTYSRSVPFALHSGQHHGNLPISLPILKLDTQSDVFSPSILHDFTAKHSSWSFSSSPSTSLEEFLLHRCHLPSSWLHECKAVSAEYEREYSIACFHYLHAGEMQQAYRLFHEHLMILWILSVIHASESGDASSTGDNDPLESALFNLLHIFLPHSSRLYNWSTHGGGLLLTYLEFRRHFVTNLQHFTYAGINAEANSLKEREERIQHFISYRKELQQFLQHVDRIDFTSSSSTSDQQPALARLAWSKMSGSVLQHLHAIQPLEEELLRERAQDEEKNNANMSMGDADINTASAVDISSGECVTAADRLAVLSDWKDNWLAQFS